MKTNQLLSVIAALLILLFVYTAVSKMMAPADFKGQLALQALPGAIKPLLFWLLPVLELAAAAALSFNATRLAGFWLSAFLMLAFTAYVLLVLLRVFGKVPCACGGVISSLGWKGHLLFNLFFLLLSVTGLIYTYRERREAWR